MPPLPIQVVVANAGTVLPKAPPVKRSYDASGRRARAEAARRRILEVARARFLAEGFIATPLPAVPPAAGVSVETVYMSPGIKVILALPVHHDPVAVLCQEP